MTRRQVFAPKFNVCRLLIVASVVWIVLLLGLHYSWDLRLIENLENENLFARNLDKENEVETFSNYTKEHTTREKVEMNMKDIRRIEKIIKQKERERAIRRLVTPISSKILKHLDLKNPGENGEPVHLSNTSTEIRRKVERGWKHHEFNEFVSDLIALNRSLPDPREEYCKQDSLHLDNLPSTSVIIIFHNEAWSTLLRSVHSVLNRSPEHLIHEIILVDDFSDMRKTRLNKPWFCKLKFLFTAHLKKPLEAYMSNIPKVKILRAEKREGLIKARIRGAVVAEAPTMTFLDSHIEAAVGWLEPLLDRIARNSTTVVCPIIDIIDDATFEFQFQPAELLQIGGFDWELIFDWFMVPESEKKRRNDPSEPVRSPTMAGGLFSIDTEFFKKLGLYDPGDIIATQTTTILQYIPRCRF